MSQLEKQLTADDRAIKTALRLSGGERLAAKKPVDDNQVFDPAAAVEKVAARGAIARADKLLDAASALMAETIRTARKSEKVELQPIKQIVDQLIANFDRCPNALLWALAANKRMRYLNRRSVGCAVLALSLGSFLGFNRKALHDLVLGALLLDIGKITVPVTILAKVGELTEQEQQFVRRHVDEGIRILETMQGLSADTLEMVRSHHERIDGSGYPAGLKGNEISLSAQVAGIVDSFDALSLSRYYSDGISGHDALGELNEERGQKFDPDLVDKFVCAIGVFPTGTWIEFDNGCMGVVCLQNPSDPMYPHVALISDSNQQPFLAVRWLTLSKQSVARAMQPDERPRYFDSMEQSLQSSVYGTWPRKTLTV
jgi:HD-GYP domain-containing protein (c-di-GMP phosphodiesterase class II)